MKTAFSIDPHPDIELGIQREKIDYYITFPDNGLNKETGLFLFIGGYGMNASSEYEKKIRQYFADKTNCLCAGVNYFGIGLKGGENSGFGYEITKKFIDSIHQCYGIQPQEYILNNRYHLPLLSKKLRSMGIAVLDSRCKLVTIDHKKSYVSFGFLPALDLLSVIAEILKNYEINKKKIFIFGTSYGGYLSLLASKFAPNTFTSVIDNSGFVKTRVNEIIDNNLESFILSHINIDGVLFPYVHKHPWTILDEYSPFYFSDSHRMIRSLLEKTHFQKNETRYFVFHSVDDQIAPTSEKDKCVDFLNEFATVTYRRISQKDIDHRVFKNTSHGMEASMKGLFELVAEKAMIARESALTDFDLNSNITFNCNNKDYIFTYENNYHFSVTIRKIFPSCTGKKGKNYDTH